MDGSSTSPRSSSDDGTSSIKRRLDEQSPSRTKVKEDLENKEERNESEAQIKDEDLGTTDVGNRLMSSNTNLQLEGNAQQMKASFLPSNANSMESIEEQKASCSAFVQSSSRSEESNSFERTSEHSNVSSDSRASDNENEQDQILELLKNNPALLELMLNNLGINQAKQPDCGSSNVPEAQMDTSDIDSKASAKSNIVENENSVELLSDEIKNQPESERVAANQTPRDWFMNQLKHLGLEKFCPGKMKQKDLLKVFPSDIDESEHLPKGMEFLQKLLHANRDCRTVFESSVSGSDEDDSCSYNTAIMIIFLCADPFLRRYLVEKMQLIQFAVPFILPLTNEVLLWPLRIVRNWRTKARDINEGCIASEAMPMMSVMQIGDFDTCVSAELLNLTFNEPGYEGFSNFVNEDHDMVSDGLVEIAWFLPRGRESDAFSNAFMAANLRGNALEHSPQTQYLLDVSDVVVIVTDSLDKVDQAFGKNKDREKIIVALKTAKSKRQFPFIHDCFQVVPFSYMEGCMRNLRRTLNENLQNSAKSLEDRTKIAESYGFTVDENENKCRNGKEKAKEVASFIEDVDVLQARKKILSFQEEWKDWTRLDKEQTRRKNFATMSLLEAHRETCELRKQEIESKLNWNSLSECFKKFLEYLNNDDEREKLFFIEWLRFFLNEKSRCVSFGFLSDVEDHFQDPQRLSEIGKQLSDSFLGIEHFFREAGMVWTVISKKVSVNADDLNWLPRTVASLLLEGYPLEILNGDASYVPYEWIKEVFHFMNVLVGPDLQVFVTSILGVQSSGKSTFLNAMFGINFAVSSGRCTKGAFMQLVEVDQKITKTLGCNYLIVIDTEGLKSAEHINYDSRHDNELGTFAVGVANLSVMNIGGENSDSMKDVLQIICFAFLRMTIVWENRPKCMMVHQNVADLAAVHNTTAGKLRFFQTLDEMTKLAAEHENCSRKYQHFKDVIDYDTKKMNIYIPGLWQGSPPMASVNLDYSDASLKTKRLLIKEITTTSSLDAFTIRIRDVFRAVKQENFIFSFQNTVAAKTHQNLAQAYNQEKWNRKTELLNWITNVEVNLRISGNYSEVEKRKVIGDVERVVNEYISKLEAVVTKYFEENQEVAGLLERSRSIFEEDIRNTKRKTTDENLRKIEELFHNFRNERNLEKLALGGEQHFKPRLLLLKKKYGEAECKLTKEQKEQLETDFEYEWATFVNGIECPQLKDEQCIESIMSSHLLDVIEGHNKHLQENPSKGLKYLVTMHDIELDGISNFKSVVHEVVPILKDPYKKSLQEAQALANRILLNCKRFIRDQTNVLENFRDSKCYDLIVFACNLIDRAKGKHFSFKQYFRVRMLQIICLYAVNEFRKMRERFQEAQDPKRKLAMNKNKYFNLLLSLVEAENHVKVFCSEIECGVLSGIQKNFKVALRNHIANEKVELCNRKQVQLAILVQLNEEASFEKYDEYLRDFKRFCLSWLRREVEAFLSHVSERGRTRFVEIMLRQSNTVLHNFSKAMDDNERKGEYQNFLRALRNSTRVNHIHVGLNEECIERLKILPVKELHKFIEEVKSHIQSETKTIVREKVEELDIKEELDQINPPIEEQLYEALMCKDGEQCPFCKAPCDVIGVHEEHKADIHQPQGFSGCIQLETITLSTEECPVSLAVNNNCFSDPITGSLPVRYGDYRRYYPNWFIPADANPATSKYWKMVLMKFNKEFAESYGTNLLTIPESWRGYQWPVVRKELEELYEQKIPE